MSTPNGNSDGLLRAVSHPENGRAENILEEANRHVHGARNKDYGHPLDNHSRTAALWSAYLGREVTAEDVCFLNILQKISRGLNSITRDTIVDVAGYAANVEMVQDERARRAARREPVTMIEDMPTTGRMQDL